MPRVTVFIVLFAAVATNVSLAQSDKGGARTLMTYTSPDGVFRVDYPHDLILCHKNPDVPGGWEPQQECGGFIPLCHSGGINPPDVLVCLGYRAAGAEKNTTFEGASFKVVDLGKKNDQASCLSMRGSGPSRAEQWKVKTIGRVEFFTTETGESVMGNSGEAQVYRTLHDKRCYELVTMIAERNAQTGETPIKSFDERPVKNAIGLPVSTFTFLK